MNDTKIQLPDIIFVVSAFILFLVSGLFNQNSYDSGDSLMHYFYSHYSWQHPGFFLHHWGKALFILLSSPFTQFGFTGMKFFQALCWSTALYFTMKTLPADLQKRKWLVTIAFLFAPKVVLSVSSGLTEPLFAAMVAMVVYFSFVKKQITAAVICSFLPFARSEGMIILLVFLTYLIFTKAWKVFPFLLIGNIAYGIAGAFYYKDALWYYHQNPYNVVVEKYGSGKLFHFVEQLQYIIGLPLYILFFAGIATLIFTLIKTNFRNINLHQVFVIYGFALAFIAAHTFFWWKGLYGSFGLNRVLLCVFPCIVLIGISGFSFIEELFSKIHAKAPLIFNIVFIFYWVVFPFTGNNAGFDFKKDFSKPDGQKLTEEAVDWAKTNMPGKKINVSIPYSAIVTGQCPFDLSTGNYLGFASPETYQPGSIYLWDNWFATREIGISESFLADTKHYQLLKCFESNDNKRKSKVCLYLRL